MQDLFQLGSQLLDDLLALLLIVFRRFTGKLLSGSADRETLFVEQVTYLANHQHIMALVITPITTPLDGLQLGKLLFPVT